MLKLVDTKKKSVEYKTRQMYHISEMSLRRILKVSPVYQMQKQNFFPRPESLTRIDGEKKKRSGKLCRRGKETSSNRFSYKDM